MYGNIFWTHLHAIRAICLLHFFNVLRAFSAWFWFFRIRESLVVINHKNIGNYLILEFHGWSQAALLKLHCEVWLSHWNGNSYLFPENKAFSTNSLNHTGTGPPPNIPHLPSSLEKQIFVHDSPTAEESDQLQCFYDFCNTNFLCVRELGERHSVLCLFNWESYWKHHILSPVTIQSSSTWTLSTNWIRKLAVWEYILIGKRLRNKYSSDFLFSEILS
jgi:hypothetical protein